jgi:hypothetical protein
MLEHCAYAVICIAETVSSCHKLRCFCLEHDYGDSNTPTTKLREWFSNIDPASVLIVVHANLRDQWVQSQLEPTTQS